MTNDKQGKSFERLSFYQLLNKTKVEIPIIQRDYAQGRETQEKVRNKFLSALYDGFKEPIELDFIYGSEEKNTLQPLDGQQRLTTLFLLHWYIATKENKLDSNVKAQLSKFTYETRASSREFCTELVEKGIVFENNAEIISDLVINRAWFVASWEKDPTISSMLIMLDAIHAKFKEESNLWEKLITTDEENRPITFLYVKLKDFGLSDDLYIKMNARGKQLTPFENFKSQFEKHIEKNGFEKDAKNPEEKFAHKIDTIWTDLFWNYRGDDGLIDNELTNFIAGIAINYYAQSDTSQTEKVKSRIRLLANPKAENGTPDIVPEDFSTKEAFQYLIACLKVYEHNHKVKTDTTPLWSYCDTTLFEDLITVSDSTQQRRVLFYAQTEYLLKNQTFSQSSFDQWMRVVRNLVENAYSGNWNIDSMVNLMKLVHRWSDKSNDIYSFLSTLDISTVSVAKEQVKEEIEKAKLIVANPVENKQIIYDTEDTNFCKGKIDFALYCIDYDNKDISTFFANQLEKIKNIFEKYLNDDDISNDFRRALFTIGDNGFYNYWGSWLYVVSANKRRIIESTNDLKWNFTKKDNYSKYLRDLVLKLCTETIDDIITDFQKTQEFLYLPNWKKRIIKEKELLDYSRSHYIAIARDESRCWLIPNKKVANNSEGKKKLKEIK
ncbi:hypothetical protein BPO_0147 [Bergeyella porcorum]|uniref:GmrSD restriction endonucleases N-terminal domain-containing protein n=1 Tax=Bergeyella porcorum TaxID=1735111 RepID=A0AAU0EYD9_9FLAO